MIQRWCESNNKRLLTVITSKAKGPLKSIFIIISFGVCLNCPCRRYRARETVHQDMFGESPQTFSSMALQDVFHFKDSRRLLSKYLQSIEPNHISAEIPKVHILCSRDMIIDASPKSRSRTRVSSNCQCGLFAPLLVV